MRNPTNCSPRPTFMERNADFQITTAEALALRDTLHLAKFVGSGRSSLKGIVAGKCVVPWRIHAILEDMRWLSTSFDLIPWNRIFREANFTVDAITAVGHHCKNLFIWDGCILVFLNELQMLCCLTVEALGVPGFLFILT